MLLFKQMFILFIIMLAGYICKKCKIITTDGSKVISSIVVNVANPALILSAGINKKETIEGKNLLFAVALAVGIYSFLIICAIIIPIVLKIKKENMGTYKVMTVFSNIGFMGFPLISAVYGSEALLYASVFLIPYNVLIYTWGIIAMNKKTGEEARDNRIVWSKIFNVGVIACILTIIAYGFHVQLPETISIAIGHFANLTAPLSMMVIGASMTDMHFKELITDKKLLSFMVLKLLVIPIVGILLIKCIGINPTLIGVSLIMLATPVGSMTAMLAQQYEGDYELASKGVALSTILSVATMPLLSLLLGV